MEVTEVATHKNFIDIDEAFKSKSPRLYKYLPGAVTRYLKRIVHQNQINDFIDRNADKFEFEFVDAIIEEFGANVIVKGAENIRTTGGVIYAANHPLGGLDAISFLHILGRYRTDVKFIVNDILLQLKNLSGIFIGVNKHGKNAKEVLDTIDNMYASEQAVLIFPAGLVSRRHNGVSKDLMWRKSFIGMARKHMRDIIPIHIEGTNSNFFHNLSWWRKKLGIKANIEMLYLVDEMYRQHDKTITVTFGKPLPWQLFDESITDADWAHRVKEHVYAMVDNDQS
ncbi:MAG: 1-acyl-sn-glycerol-3-phosphate acyltransferase, partial [Bacteroidia bacterium]